MAVQSADRAIQVRLLGKGEADVLRNVAPGVFDYDLRPDSLAAFFPDPRHHLAVALDGETVVGMAGGIHYVHPDKPPELYINEVGVADEYQGQGLGRWMLDALLAHARTLGCVAAWVLTEEDNTAARRLYASAGGKEQAGVVMSLFDLESGAQHE